jgi:2-haloacid dehalogenase/putative hydrolase of the HAD superfamily
MCAESFGASFRSQKELEQRSLQRVLEYFEAELDCDPLCQLIIGYWARPALFPESKAVLAACDIPICLVSNIDQAELDSALSHHQLSFDWVVTSEACRAYKPRREMFDKALSLVGLPAAKVLHVGDSYGSDIRGAKALKIPVLWINRKNRQVPQQGDTPDYVSADLSGILRLLRREI